MPTVDLDRTDLRILEILQADGRLSNQEIADRVSLSPSPCLRRIRRLEDMGVIRQYVALVDPQKIGLGLLAYVTVKLEKRGKMPMDEFRARVQTWPEVLACYAMTGDMDYLLRVHVEDLEHFSRLVMNQLLKQPGVVDVKSSFALDRIKETTALPLKHLAGT
ncbi:MAG: Lrp/AsnC family transcriptional regulator [Burkholderiaceae bacterium]|jgi:Lrp/AsnC family leucine-responsive transcriptional regulator|nr:Lrp/AsnC family transcriptional regulator [Burkholderiaceae bacterium]